MEDCASLNSSINNNQVFTPNTSISDVIGHSWTDSVDQSDKVLAKGRPGRKRKYAKTHSLDILESTCATVVKSNWTDHEDTLLKELVLKHGAKSWKKISAHFTNRTDVQ